MASGFNPQKKDERKGHRVRVRVCSGSRTTAEAVHRTSAPRCTWAASTSAVNPAHKLSFNFSQFHPSLLPSPPPLNKQAFLVLDNRARSYHFRTFSIAAMTLLMSSLALLRVSARTDLPDIAAVGLIFVELAGSFSSDTMQTVERTEEPLRLRGLMERGGGGCSCTMKRDESPCCESGRTKSLQTACIQPAFILTGGYYCTAGLTPGHSGPPHTRGPPEAPQFLLLTLFSCKKKTLFQPTVASEQSWYRYIYSSTVL